MLSKKQQDEIIKRVVAGDTKAINFMVGYPSMSDDEANEYLATLAIDDGTNAKQNFSEMNLFLIKDENEAINGYDKAILLAQNDGNDKALAVYQSIKADELRHIDMLKMLEGKKDEGK